MGNVQVEPCESSPTNVFDPRNDDGDPSTLDAAGFNWAQSINAHDLVVAPGMPFGFTDFYLGPVVSTGFALRWAPALRTSDYSRYLDEVAEHVLAVVLHWRDTYGITPRLIQLWNEPTSGNHELVGGTATEMVDMVARVGDRLRAAGISEMRFVVPAEETEELSLDRATRILEDARARPYVGAIAYHPYPYGSAYASVPNILAASGRGAPNAVEVDVRRRLRDLGALYGVPVFMAEVSHSELPFDDFGNVRGRAIHIHDELVYADAAAFFGMNAMWDTVSHAQHFMGRPDPGFWNETDTIVLIDVENARVVISPMGRALGHWARWIDRGAVRVGATSDDPLVLLTAFREPTRARLVVVAVNNATEARELRAHVAGAPLGPTFEGELSTASAPWAAITGATTSPTDLTYTMPPLSVATFSIPLAGVVETDAGPGVDAGSEVDAGEGVDGSTTPADGATADLDGGPLSDGAAARTDGSSGAADAGFAGGGGATCSCRAGGGRSSLGCGLALGLVMLFARVRRARRTSRAA